jgi:ferredoxin
MGDLVKLVLDQDTCQGYGLCQAAAPGLVDLDDLGYAQLIGGDSVPTSEHNHAHDAVAACPARALRVHA